MNFVARLFLLEDKGRHDSVHFGLFIGRFWHGPASHQSPALPRLSLRFRLVQLAPSGGLRPALTTGLMGRADFSP
jgi:hypothetical protein